MNNKNLFQFSLTAICSVVLAACGSGGSSNPTTVAEPTITPSATPETPAPTMTPAVTDNTQAPNPETHTSKVEDIDAQELATLASETPFLGYKHVNKRNSGLITNTDANGSKRNHSDIPVGMNVKNPSPVMDTLVVVEPKPTGTETVHKVGYLEDLDFRAGASGAAYTEAQAKADGVVLGTSGVTTSQDSAKNQVNGAFSFQRTQGNMPTGANKLFTVHVNKSNTADNTVSELRSGSHAALAVGGGRGQLASNNNTKSERMAIDGNTANEAYFAYHYQVNRTNYTDETFKHNELAVPVYTGTGANRKLTGYEYVNSTGTNYDNKVRHALTATTTSGDNENLIRKSRTDLVEWNKNPVAANNTEVAKSALHSSKDDPSKVRIDKNVAEIYGYRTFPRGSTGYTIGSKIEDLKLANLPLEDKQLQHVQYGRITTYLSDSRGFDEFRRGLDTDGVDKGIDTYVVSYGTFGKDGTEDQYFYRGINHLHGDDLKKLSANTSGTLKYWGHAVAYGLDDKWDGNPVSNSAPTAIGGNSVGRFVSGNHAYAAVDLKSGKVDGAIYNTWYNQDVADAAKKAGNNDPKAGIYPVDLVRFNGLLASNGNITGTAVYRKNGTEGLFGATLYGKDAREIGGVVASHDKTENNKWGAVFGAVRADGIGNATNLSGQ